MAEAVRVKGITNEMRRCQRLRQTGFGQIWILLRLRPGGGIAQPGTPIFTGTCERYRKEWFVTMYEMQLAFQ